jgi:hypothetical protein
MQACGVNTNELDMSRHSRSRLPSRQPFEEEDEYGRLEGL